MTDQEIRDTLRQMLKDWDAATPEQRKAALAAAEQAARVKSHLDAGQDPELEKLVTKRADEWGVSRQEALIRLLPA